MPIFLIRGILKYLVRQKQSVNGDHYGSKLRVYLKEAFRKKKIIIIRNCLIEKSFFLKINVKPQVVQQAMQTLAKFVVIR